MAIDDNASYELTGYQVKDLAQKIRAKADSSSLATVATSGLYSDLTGAPTIPTVYNGTLTVTQNGVSVGTFTANQSGNTTVALTDTTYSDFVGSTGVADGAAGLVPKPLIADTSKFLKGDGTWDTPADTTYTAGTNVSISAQNVISATDTTYSAFGGATSSVAGSAGLVPAPTTSDPGKYLKGDGTWGEPAAKLVEMAYGESNAWAKFIAAYNAGSIVYCRASSNTNPATGSQTRKAFMAYVNNATSPTQVEFQYVRSVSSKTSSQPVDQVFVYTLTNSNGGTWSVTTRDMGPKLAAGTGIGVNYGSGTYTISANAMTGASAGTAGTAGIVPAPAAGDQDKFLKGDGTWATAGGGGGNTVTYIATDLLQMIYSTAMQDAQAKGVLNIMQNLLFPNPGFVFLKDDGTEVVPASEIGEKFGQGYDIKLKCVFQQYGGMNVQPGFEKVNGSIIAADPYSLTNFPMVMTFMQDNAINVGSGGTFIVKVQQSAQGSDSKTYGTFTKL